VEEVFTIVTQRFGEKGAAVEEGELREFTAITVKRWVKG
jgi:hypothetical protein